MAENQNNNTNESDEIDLGQLFKMINNAFNAVFRGFLRFFLYLKRNALILIGLAVLGVGIGFGLKQILSKKMKIEVIVRPNLESKEYMYDVVNEIQANIKAENEDFFQEMGIEVENLKGFEITVEPLGDKKSKLEDELKYLELLKGLDISGSVSDIVRNEILERNSLNHRIIFTYQSQNSGHEYAQKIVNYINSNPYFIELIEIYRDNAQNRIERNSALIAQIDELIENYTQNLANQAAPQGESRIVLDNEERMDIRALFDLKNDLIKDMEVKKVELKKQTEAVKIINFGKPHEVIKPFFGKKLVLLPTLFIGAFFLWSIIKYLNKKASELE
ncbi:hypothetical protein [Flagellimonas lutaonensis]|uniref:Uncharacterized protein n=1 Tax=Flagellimonas lutaonensis TaxID=516051 RepID=A0A0D5YRS5_9FLAO|nr:hypothetical protein [Allomuricauda lutaonensis]AKA34982.1 hypothetical protein VC82_1354 [Allomuricauda lutaonensis]